MLIGTITSRQRLTGRISTGSGGGPSSYIPLDVEEIEVVDTIIGSMIGEVQQAPPITINSAGTDTIAMTIYGAEGGVGDYDQTTEKYLIPVTVERTNLFDNSDYNLVACYPNTTGTVLASAGSNSKCRSLILPATEGKSYCISVRRGKFDRFRVGAYASTPSAGSTGTIVSGAVTGAEYSHIVFTAPESTTHLLLFLWASYEETAITSLIESAELELQFCESSVAVYYYSSTTTVSLDEPLLAGQYAVLQGSDLPTLCAGSNTITIDTTIQPGEVYIRYFEMR